MSVKYNGQPERDAGEYPTRQQAARAAARAAGIVGEHGAPPVKVGVHESSTGGRAGATAERPSPTPVQPHRPG